MQVYSEYSSPQRFQLGGGHDPVTITPGPNEIPEESEEQKERVARLKEHPGFQSRADDEYFEVGKGREDMSDSDFSRLERPADTAMIRHLSKRSKELENDEVFDGSGATSPQGQIKKMEDQLQKMKRKFSV